MSSPFSYFRGIEADFERLGGGGVLVMDAGDFGAARQRGAEFFAELAGEGGFRGFVLAFADFAAGEFPFQRRGVGAAALADEDAAVGALDYGGDDTALTCERGFAARCGARRVSAHCARKKSRSKSCRGRPRPAGARAC